MSDWRLQPLGFAVVDQTKSGALAIHHVAIDDAGVHFTGLWSLKEPSFEEVVNLITHWIVIGTVDGIGQLESLLGNSVQSADLATWVTACEEADDLLRATWVAYRDAEPKKRSNLKPLGARTWPAISEDGDALKILRRVGLSPIPSNTPPEMRDVLALAYLVRYVAETWFELETERLGRTYLSGGLNERQLYPPVWLEGHESFWPDVLAD